MSKESCKRERVLDEATLGPLRIINDMLCDFRVSFNVASPFVPGSYMLRSSMSHQNVLLMHFPLS